MAERVVQHALASYVRDVTRDGVLLWAHGLRGDTVQVHESDLERWDSLNPPQPETEPAHEPEPLQPTPNPDTVEPPPGNGSLEAWRDYAITTGATEAELDGLTRDQIRDRYRPQ